MWCRHARKRRFLSRAWDRSSQAPCRIPAFEAVVSNERAWTRHLISQSSRQSSTAWACVWPDPESILGTARSFSTPSPDTRTGKRSTVSFPVRSSIIFPSQWTTRGPLTEKVSFMVFARSDRRRARRRWIEDLLILSVSGSTPTLVATVERTYVAFREDTCVLSRAAARSGLMTFLEARCRLGDEQAALAPPSAAPSPRQNPVQNLTRKRRAQRGS